MKVFKVIYLLTFMWFLTTFTSDHLSRFNCWKNWKKITKNCDKYNKTCKKNDDNYVISEPCKIILKRLTHDIEFFKIRRCHRKYPEFEYLSKIAQL